MILWWILAEKSTLVNAECFSLSNLLFFLTYTLFLHFWNPNSSVMEDKFQVTVHSHVNHSADWHGGCTFCPECISPIAVGDSKWRDTLLFAGYLWTVTVSAFRCYLSGEITTLTDLENSGFSICQILQHDRRMVLNVYRFLCHTSHAHWKLFACHLFFLLLNHLFDHISTYGSVLFPVLNQWIFPK